MTKKILTLVFALLLCRESEAFHSWNAQFVATAYVPWVTGTYKTASGKHADPAKKYVAVDRKLIPLGSKVCIQGMGCYTAEDTGGDIKGLRLDILMPNLKVCREWGRRRVSAEVYPVHKKGS